MSDDKSSLDLREQIARIDRDQAEVHKLMAETRKFSTEQQKLSAEAAKLDRDRWLAPALAIAAVIGGLLGAATFIAKVIH
jgi:Tfp pilus assembly protein PilN